MDTETISPQAASGGEQRAPIARRRFIRNLVIMLSPFLLLFGVGCSCISSSYSPNVSLRTTRATDAQLHLFLDLFATGVFTPTEDGRVILDGQTAPAAIDLNELAAKGYVAVRVPHAPPSYVTSTLQAGLAAGAPGARFEYFSPPTSMIPTSVPVTLTRHMALEQSINTRFPITDGASHWEVWWLAEGAQFPIPAGPFRLDDTLSTPLALQFNVDFGGDAAATCHGCSYEYLIFDGATLHGPFAGTVAVDAVDGSAVARFGAECTFQEPPIATLSAALLTPGQPFTFTYCLENYDNQPHTFAIAAHSQQGWGYTFYTQTVGVAAAPALVGSAPFQVRTPGKGQFWPGMLAIHAVFTPTFAADANINEALELRATSLTNPVMTTAGAGFGASLGFTPTNSEQALYLPMVARP